MKSKLTFLTLLMSLVFFSVSFADTEPANDVYTGADILSENGSVSGTIYIDPVDDLYDWYQVTTSHDGDITISFTCTAGEYNRIYLYDSDGTTSFGSAAGTATASFTKTGLAAGTYYVKYDYYSASNASEYELSCSVSSEEFANDVEPNNIPSEALIMAENSNVNGHIGYRNNGGSYDTDDWYQFTTSEDGDINISISNNTGEYTRIYLYDQDGTTSFGSHAGTAAASFTKTGLAAGTYYARVDYYSSSYYSQYTLSNSVAPTNYSNDNEPNDVYTLAQPLAENDSVYGHIGHRYNGGSYDEDDWYVFNTTSNGQISLVLSNETNQYNRIYLYDADGTTSLGFANGYGGATIAVDGLAAGTYYARVYYYGTTYFSGYKLKNIVTTTAYANDSEPNDGPVQALNMVENDSVYGHIGHRYNGGTYDEDDWYVFNTTSNGQISLVLSNETNQYNRIYLYDSDGTTSLGFANGYGGATISVIGLAAGTYYARVYYYGSTYFSGYKLKNIITPTEYESDLETNDSPAQASSMEENVTVFGHIGHRYNGGSYDEDDYYSFTTANDGKISLVLANNTNQYNRIYLYDSDGTTSFGSAQGYGGATFTVDGLAAGNYYARVYYYGSTYFSGYNLTAVTTPADYTNDAEPNDDFGTAVSMPTNSTANGHIGYRYNGGSFDVSDYYKINTHSSGDIILSFTNTNNAYNRIYLYNSAEVSLGSIDAYGSATKTFSDLPAGTYYARMYYYNSTYFSAYTLTNNFCPDAITINATGETTFCYGESVTLSTEDHHLNYLWSDGSTTETNAVSLTGDYSLTIDNGNGCVRTSNTITAESKPLPVAIISADGPTEICDGESVTLSVPNGPDGYLWSNGATTPEITVSTTGDYSVQLFKNNCTAISDPIHIHVHPIPSAAISPLGPVTVCNGESVTLSALGGFDSYEWSTGETTSSIEVNTTGEYTLTVTDNDCSASSQVSVSASTQIVINETVTNPLCNGDLNGSIDASIAGGTSPFVYEWNNGSGTEDISGIGAGNYSLQVTDNYGCTNSKGIIVEEPDALSSSETHGNESSPGAADGNIDVTVDGGTPDYSYLWNDGATTQDRTGLSAGIYDLTITDANGCTSTLSASIAADGCVCVVPDNIVVNNVTSSQATLTWTGNECATGYEIHRRKSGEIEWGTSSFVDALTFEKLFKNMSPNTTFEVQVQSICDGSSSGFSESVFFTTTDGCTKPKALKSSNITSTTADVSWTIVVPATNWVIFYYPDGGETLKKNIDGSSTETQLTGLLPNTPYNWYMKAKCGDDKSNQTTIKTFKTGYTKIGDELVQDQFKVSLFPNPTTSILFISYENFSEGKVTTRLFDVNGRLVMLKENNESIGVMNFELDLSSLAAGAYQLQLISADGRVFNQSVIRVKE